MVNWIRYRKRKFRPRLEDIANLDLIGYYYKSFVLFEYQKGPTLDMWT